MLRDSLFLVSNIFLNINLIPRFNALGAASATFSIYSGIYFSPNADIS